MKALGLFFSDLFSALFGRFDPTPPIESCVTTCVSDPLWFATLPRRFVRRRIRRRHPWIV